MAKNFDEVMRGYQSFCREFYGFLPYIWLEARLANPFEYKLLILSNDVEGSPRYGLLEEPVRVFCKQPDRVQKTASDEEVKMFAKSVFRKYRETHGMLCWDKKEIFKISLNNETEL